MNGKTSSMKNVLYEPPGPRTRKYILVCTIASVLVLVALAAAVIRQFYINGQLAARYWSFFTKSTTWKFLGQGLAGTVAAAIVSGTIAFALGMLLMLGRISRNKLVCGVSRVLIEFTRGVPTLLLIYFFFLVVPQLGVTLSAFWKIAAPVAISASGVVAEVLRSGVNAVPKGQSEAAQSLGMRWRSVFFKIIFPQALRYVVPAMISELVIVLKDTTFAYVVSYADLMQNAKVLISNYDALLSVYLVVAVIYILINYVLHRLSVFLTERNTAEDPASNDLERNWDTL